MNIKLASFFVATAVISGALNVYLVSGGAERIARSNSVREANIFSSLKPSTSSANNCALESDLVASAEYELVNATMDILVTDLSGYRDAYNSALDNLRLCEFSSRQSSGWRTAD